MNVVLIKVTLTRRHKFFIHFFNIKWCSKELKSRTVQ